MASSNIKIAGIDYSMTSPAVCVYTGNKKKWNARNCSFHFFYFSKKHTTNHPNLIPSRYPEYSSPICRFENLARWTNDVVYGCESVMVEGYSFGSSGRVFDIAENCGILKHKLWYNDVPYVIAEPTVIKKYATGKGNADKQKMFDSYKKEKFSIDLHEELNIKTTSKIGGPISDVVDSYWICKLLFTRLLESNP